MNDDITVVITCFNDGAYLSEAVVSALEQEGGKPRVTVVDDGSTDAETVRALDRLPESVKLIRQTNAGTSAARNTGLAAARTPYLIVVDADDRLAPAALRLLRLPLDHRPHLGFSYGVMRFFGDWDGTLSFPPYDPYKLLYRHIIGLAALMRSQLFEQVGGFDSAFSGYEDWEFWLHAMSRGWHGQKVDAVTYMYRRHGYSRHLGARFHYRATFRQLRRKHAELYDRQGQQRLLSQSGLRAWERFIYRWWWGLRPLPARAELALQSVHWRPGRNHPGGH